MASRLALFVLVIALLFVVHASSNSSNQEQHLAAHYSYSGATGPSKWASLDPKYTVCATGKAQSPINIERKIIQLNKDLKPLTRTYNPSNATLANNHVSVGLHLEENSGVLVAEGKEYKLKQMHWHTPSEHTIDGIHYDAELHLVHMANDSTLSVLGVLYQLGQPDPLLAKLQKKLDELAHMVNGLGGEGEIPLGKFNMNQLKKHTRKYYRYAGSFTSPPCTEIVHWYILGKVKSISQEQIEALKAPLGTGFKNNSRPVQPRDGRKIELYAELLTRCVV